MPHLLSFLILIIGLTSCEWDDFHSVSKIIEAPAEVELDQPFNFIVKLKNETDSLLPLTLDKHITKSLHFRPWWYCEDAPIRSKAPNPKNQKQKFYSVNLKPGDSLIFELTAQMKTFSNNDSIRFIIEGYEREFVLAFPNCKDLNMTLEGMWLPGNGPMGDSMEGYDFSTKIKIKTTANSSKMQLPALPSDSVLVNSELSVF